jgi:hypothetical protein
VSKVEVQWALLGLVVVGKHEPPSFIGGQQCGELLCSPATIVG